MTLGIFEIDTLRDASGNAVVVTGADVEVRNEATGALVALYEDADGNTPLDNPFSPSGSTIRFYCDTSARFRVDIESGSFSRALRHRVAQAWLGEVQEFEPAVTFATPGDLSVDYSGSGYRFGRVVRIGRLVQVHIDIRFVPSYTTASGVFFILVPANLLPESADHAAGRVTPLGPVRHGANMSYPSGRTDLCSLVEGLLAGDRIISLECVGSGASAARLTSANFTSEATSIVGLSGSYIAAEGA